MSAKEFKTFCRIIDYVHSANPDLGAIMVGVCSDLPLNSLKGKPGITFLMPQDKAFLDTLEKLAYSDKTEEANKAGEMLNALIIRDYIRSPAEWKSREISNSLYPAQVVEVESTTAKEVVFKSGAKAVLDEKFRDASRRQNLAVWKLTGSIPVTTDKLAKPPQRKPQGKTGAYQPDAVHAQRLRFKIGIIVENEYAAACAHSHAVGRNGATTDVYQEYSLSLVDFILHERKDRALALERVIPMIGFDKMDFYFLVEPHKNGGEYLLDDNLINEWWSWKRDHKCSISSVTRDINSILNDASGTGLIYTDRSKVLEAIARARASVAAAIDGRPRQAVDDLAKVYTELESSNTISGVGPIYPTGVAHYYASEPGLKMMHDELRYRAFGAFAKLEAELFDVFSYHHLVNLIGECLHAGTSERDGQRKLLSRATVRSMISPTELIDEIKVFLYSTMFLQIPLTPTDADQLKQKYTTSRPDPANMRVYNIAKLNFTRHARILTHDALRVGHDLTAALRSIDPATLDPHVRAELLAKLSA